MNESWSSRVPLTHTKVEWHPDYAAAYTGSLRAISEPGVWSVFDQREGDVETVDSLYERIRDCPLAEPERYSWHYILVAALLPRR
jgi:hypothetical protein